MKARFSRGASLMEALVVVAVMGIILLVASKLFTGYADVVRHSQEKGRQFEIAQHSLEVVCEELSQALATVTPITDGVTYTKIFYNGAPAFLSNEPHDPLPPSFGALGANRIQAATIRLAPSRELLKVTTSRTELLGSGVDGFRVLDTVPSDPLIEVELTMRSEQKITILRRKVYLWAL